MNRRTLLIRLSPTLRIGFDESAPTRQLWIDPFFVLRNRRPRRRFFFAREKGLRFAQGTEPGRVDSVGPKVRADTSSLERPPHPRGSADDPETARRGRRGHRHEPPRPADRRPGQGRPALVHADLAPRPARRDGRALVHLARVPAQDLVGDRAGDERRLALHEDPAHTWIHTS